MTARQDLSLQQHPLSAAFPAMPENELGALSLDIEAHGQREPGVIFEGMVLDGWHRYLACQGAGVEFKSTEFDGADPMAFVLSRNLHRRHLTAAQRVAAVAECAKWAPAHRPSEKGGSASPLTTNALTNQQIAHAADASVKTVKQVKAAIRAGLGDAVKEGKVSAERAAEIAKLPPAKREKALAEPPKPRGIIADRKFEKLYEEVKAKLVEVMEQKDELADVARELNEKLEAFETTELDEQQKLIAGLQLTVRKKDAEIDRLRVQIRDANNKNNELIRTVKRLQKHG